MPEYCVPVFAHRDLGWFRARQFSTSAAGNAPLSGDSGIRCPSTSTLLGSPVASVSTVGVMDLMGESSCS